MKALEGAVRALSAWDPRRGSLKLGLEELSGNERGTTLAWVHGVLRRRRTLGHVLGAVARRALKGRRPELVALLEVLAYRVLYEGEETERALAGLGGSKRSREHAQRVLLALDEAIAERVAGAAEGHDALLPVGRSEAVRFRRPLLDVSRRGAAGRLALLHSLPDALVEAWIRDRGPEVATALCWAANDPPPLFARANPLWGDRSCLAAALAAEGVEATPVEGSPSALRLGAGRGRFRHTAPWREGALFVQDLTAQEAAPLLAPRPGERVLDLCAAPGGKTTHLAELAGDRARLLACDVSARRLRRVVENARRLGLASVRTQALDGTRPGALAGLGPFDAVLIDAPCSNTGVLRRRSEARWRYDRRAQRRLVTAQERLLAAGLGTLAPGGRLLYSVCSVERDEGEALVRRVLESHAEVRLAEEVLRLPTPEGGDGGYLALLRRGEG
ncbi:MAG: hypothetical protein D6731_00310 [Planctomycetota bacterium]|nr:MAG: hypothetical protein D6731_00310 [Planctomycetota bacterium]